MKEKLVSKLIDMGFSISFMESCTGGALANEITSVPGASEILKFSAVTYSNEYKIKMGVSSEVILQYSVYSMETAREMSKNISLFSNSDIGVGVTGRINRLDPNNLGGDVSKIYISIYFRKSDIYTSLELEAINGSREENKRYIVDSVINKLLEILE